MVAEAAAVAAPVWEEVEEVVEVVAVEVEEEEEAEAAEEEAAAEVEEAVAPGLPVLLRQVAHPTRSFAPALRFLLLLLLPN